MKIAVPVSGNKVCKRCDRANKYILYTIENNEILGTQEVYSPIWLPLEKIQEFLEWKIDAILCGEVDKFCKLLLGTHGIKVYEGIFEDRSEVIELLLKGQFHDNSYKDTSA
jgi:predicted Fe-Mo cluster-binding NifX family protein